MDRADAPNGCGGVVSFVAYLSGTLYALEQYVASVNRQAGRGNLGGFECLPGSRKDVGLDMRTVVGDTQPAQNQADERCKE